MHEPSWVSGHGHGPVATYARGPMHACIHIYIHIYIYLCLYGSIYIFYIYMYIFTCIYTCIYTLQCSELLCDGDNVVNCYDVHFLILEQPTPCSSQWSPSMFKILGLSFQRTRAQFWRTGLPSPSCFFWFLWLRWRSLPPHGTFPKYMIMVAYIQFSTPWARQRLFLSLRS